MNAPCHLITTDGGHAARCTTLRGVKNLAIDFPHALKSHARFR